MRKKIILIMFILANVVFILVLLKSIISINENNVSLNNTILEKNIELENNNVYNEDLRKENELLIEKSTYLESLIDEMTKKVGFNPYNLRQISGANEFHFAKAFKGTPLEGQGLEGAFVDAEKNNVNGFFLAGIVALESNYGTSNIATTNNNLGGVGMYSSASRGVVYSSKYESIIHIAEFLDRDYLSETGKYYNGSNIWAVNVSYCPNDDFHWGNTVERIAKEFLEKANSEV